jgi:hypothetical protein
MLESHNWSFAVYEIRITTQDTISASRMIKSKLYGTTPPPPKKVTEQSRNFVLLCDTEVNNRADQTKYLFK